MGSKENSNSFKKRITFRLTGKEWDKLVKILDSSPSRSLSELIRKALFEGKVIVISNDTSFDKAMEQLSGIRTELHRIGININQVTRRFHTEDLPEAKLFQAMEIVKLYQQTDLKVTELFTIIAKLSTRWLPE